MGIPLGWSDENLAVEDEGARLASVSI